MIDQVESIKNNPKKYYTVTDLVRTRIIPWAKHNRTINKIIEADLEGYSVLKAEVSGTDEYRQYRIAKKNLIKYLKIYGPALMATVRKQNYERTKIREKVSRNPK